MNHWPRKQEVNLNTVPGYEDLEQVLSLAYDRAAKGKGKERHADDLPFRDQWIIEGLEIHGIGAALFQAEKKIREVKNIKDPQAKANELLDVMVYMAAAVLVLSRQAKDSIAPGRVPEKAFYYGDATLDQLEEVTHGRI